MTDDVARLVIRVESLEAMLAEKRLKKLEGQGGRTERATDGLTKSFTRLAAPLAGIVSISAGLNKLFETTKQIQNLDVQLQTATGSAEAAAEALDLIKDFAEDTKQPVNDVAQAFVKLKNLGLDPSEQALLSYGNTAAAMGKDLDQLIEAVADAATGEFERLKEFGIKSSSEGDRVSFTFQGMTTTVGKNAAEIEGYLQSLGENQFAGALEKKAETLEGSVNQLQNSWNELFEEVSKQGSDEIMVEVFNTANDALKTFTESIASGQLQGNIEAIGGKFDGLTQDVINAFTILEELFRNEFQLLEDTGVGSVDLIGDAFLNMPENIRAAIQLAATELAYFVDRVGIFGEEIAHDLNPKNWFSDDEEFQTQIENRIKAADSARLSSIETILAERDAKVQNYQDEVAAVNAAAEAQLRLNAARSGKTLGDFGSKKNNTENGSESEQKQAKFAEQYEILLLQLEIEETAIAESYAKRQQFINSSLAAGLIQQGKWDKETLKAQRDYLRAKEGQERASARTTQQINQSTFQSGMGYARAAFAEDKKASKTIGAIKTIEAVMSAYAAGSKVNPYVGAAFAALAFKAQNDQMQKLDSTSFGGGSVGGGISSGGSVPSVSIPELPTTDTTPTNDDESAKGGGGNYYLTFNGLSTLTQADQMVELLQIAFGNDEIPIPANSRQAQIIREG